MSIFSEHSILFLVLILGCAAALMGLGFYGIMVSVRSGKEQHASLSTMLSLRRQYSQRQKNRPWALVYVGLSLHQMRNSHSQTEVGGVYDHVKQMLLQYTCLYPGDLIANYDGKNYVMLTCRNESEFQHMMKEFFIDLNRYAAVCKLVHLPEVHFGYYAAKSNDVGFDDGVSRAKQAYKYAETTRKDGCVWDFEMMRSEAEVEQLERRISDAIENDEFILEFQPFVDGDTKQIIGGEVLTRLNLPERSLVGPAQFLRAVASMGLFSQFDYYVFEKCCAWAACQIERNRSIRWLSCNFSRYTISLPDFAKKIVHIADRYGVPHHILAVEITEEDQEVETVQIARNLETLHQAGFTIFLDDFGCGFTSFDDLQNYKIDVVKVDKSLLDRTETERGRVIFRHVVGMAKELNCNVLCEGIETQEQFELVKLVGADIVQGYYFYKALPAEKFNALFEPAPLAETV